MMEIRTLEMQRKHLLSSANRLSWDISQQPVAPDNLDPFMQNRLRRAWMLAG
jgi:hypothetical protein